MQQHHHRVNYIVIHLCTMLMNTDYVTIFNDLFYNEFKYVVMMFRGLYKAQQKRK